jgi:hypothetical protein
VGRVYFVETGDARILFIDFSNCDLADAVPIIREARGIIASQPPGSLLTLTNVAGARVSPALAKVMKEFADHNKPYVRAGAVVGLSGVMRGIYEAVVKFTGRDLPVFQTIDDARAWLLQQNTK